MVAVTCHVCREPLAVDGLEPFTLSVCANCGARFVVPLPLGRFFIYSALRDVGAFTVHEGFDPATDQPVLAYTLNPELADYDRWRAVTEREARLEMDAGESGGYPLSAMGEDAEGTFYFVAPALRGVFLDEHLAAPANRPFKVASVIEFARELAVCLDQAASRGLIHHDLCPENIHIDSDEIIRAHGFAISHVNYLHEAETGGPPSVSPYFISPERAEFGREGPEGAVFAFGVLFYYLLTGRYPFYSDNELVTIYSRVKGGANDMDPSNPYARLVNPKAVGYHRPPLASASRAKTPKAVSELIDRALSPEPGQRPNFLEIVQALDAQKDRETTGISLADAAPAAARPDPTLDVADSRPIPLMRDIAVGAKASAANRRGVVGFLEDAWMLEE